MCGCTSELLQDRDMYDVDIDSCSCSRYDNYFDVVVKRMSYDSCLQMRLAENGVVNWHIIFSSAVV